MFKTFVITGLICCFCSISVFAEIPFFFDGARPMGMGGAFTAVADDENAIQYNPAGLAQIKKSIVTISGLLMNYSWGYDLESSLSRDWNYFNAECALSYVQKNIGVQINYKIIGDPINDINMYDGTTRKDLEKEIQGVVAFGIGDEEGLKLGINIKYNCSSSTNSIGGSPLDGFRFSNGFSFDIGSILNITKDISLGLMIQNLFSTRINCPVRDEVGGIFWMSDVPQYFNMGISWRIIKEILVSMDVYNLFEYISKIYDSFDYQFKRSYHFGIEATPLDNLSVRIGGFWANISAEFSRMWDIDYKNRFTLAIGGSYIINPIKINFALANDFRKVANIDSPFQYSLSVSWMF